ncbi:alternate-type signal peptide domain-containing protein [Microbacterium sp. MC2]
MNKFVKGSIAAAAATVLLLGGAGSLAYWNSDAGLKAVSINAGTLALSVDGDPTWDAPTLWVPGDEAVYEATLNVVATGDNIQGALSLDETSLQITGAAADQFDVTFDADTTGLTGMSFDAASGLATFTDPGTYKVPVTVTVEFPFGTSVDNTAKNATVNVSGLKFLLTQTDATP